MADALGSISAGPLSITEGQTYTDNISNSFDVDYFKLPASLFTAPSQIDVSFGGSFSSLNNLFTVSIVDQSDTMIATVSSGVPTTLSGSVAAGSAYYLKVAQAESLDTTSYTLSYDLHPGVIITGNSSDALIKDNSSTNQTLTASIIGTPSADVNVIVDAPEGLTISGSNISVLNADANTYVFKLSSSDVSNVFTVSASNSATSGTDTLEFSSVSIDADYNELNISSLSFPVLESNSEPILVTPSSFSIDEDTASSAITFSATDADGDALTYSFSTPSKGTVANNGDGTYTYTPSANQNGSDSFIVTVSDGIIDVSQTVDVVINAVNDPPVLTISDALSADEDTSSSAIAFGATDADGDTLTYAFGTPSKGAVVDNGDSTYSYTPHANENGTDSFTITVNDGTVDTTRTINVAISAVNDSPVISAPTSLTTNEDMATSAIAFSGGDVDGDSLNFTFSNPVKGSVQDNGNGTFTYTPNANENGADSFTITASDGTVDVLQNVDVTISAVNDRPVFTSGAESVLLENATLSSVIYNAKAEDPDGDQLTYSLINSLNILVAGESANGEIKVALFDDIAPLHTERLGTLAAEGAYNDIVFHRVIDGFMAQTGDVQYGKRENSLENAGRGGSDKPDLVEEFSTIPFDRGIVGMARSSDPDSANSQFFMMFENYYSLNEAYTVVGEIASGLNVLDSIKRGDTSANGKVAENPDYMSTVTFSSATTLLNIGEQSGPPSPGANTAGEITFKSLPDFSSLGFVDFIVSASDGTETTFQTVRFTLPTQDINIKIMGPNEAKDLLPDKSLVFLNSGSESTKLSTSNGKLATLWQELSFSHVEFNTQNYDHGIAINDVVLQLRDIVGLNNLSGTQKIAADIDGDGDVTINDVVSNLRHIVGLDTIEQCALVDTSAQSVTSLDASTIADLTLIQLGDVDLSATFVDVV